MNNAADSTRKPPSDTDSASVVPVSFERRQAISEMKAEINAWQTRIDAAKLQMHLGAKEAREKLRPHVEKLEQEMERVNAAWTQLQESSTSAWQDTQHGLRISLLAIRRSFDKAKHHFENPDDS